MSETQAPKQVGTPLLKSKESLPSLIEGRYGLPLRIALKLISEVQFPEEEARTLKDLSERGAVVHALSTMNHLEPILLNYYYRQKGFAAPSYAFDTNLSLFQSIGRGARSLFSIFSNRFLYRRKRELTGSAFLERLFQEGRSSVLFIDDQQSFLRRFTEKSEDPFLFLIKMQERLERPIFILPQMILWEKSPERTHKGFFGGKEAAGALRRFFNLLINRRRAFIRYAEPINLQATLQEKAFSTPEEAAFWLRRETASRLQRERLLITGPVLKSRQEIFEQVLYDEEVLKEIDQIMLQENKPLGVVRKQAYKQIEEIAADYNISYIQMWNVVLTYVFNHIFNGIEVDEEGLAEVRRVARQSPIVLVPSHKSHMDYLILSYIFYNHNQVPPHIAAGHNLSFFPMGHIFRKSGAFFIRRTFKGLSLYPVIFSKYIQVLLKEGFPIEFFIEGGRSRSGRLVLPKLGFLSMLMDSYQKGIVNDLNFIPIAITYDRLLEEKSHAEEILGSKSKETENVGVMLKSSSLLTRRYGKVYVTFDRPISLKRYFAQRATQPSDAPPLAKTEEPRFDFGYRLARAINRATIVTPFSLTAAAVLVRDTRGFSYHDLRYTARLFYNYLAFRKLRFADSLSRPELLEPAIRETLRVYASSRMIRAIKMGKEPVTDEGEMLYALNHESRINLEYYKNNILHFMLPMAFTAVAMMSSPRHANTYEDLLVDFYLLRSLLNYDFIFPVEDKSRRYLQQSLDYLLQINFIEKIEDKYILKPRYRQGLASFGGLIFNYLESYFIVAKSIKNLHQRRLNSKEFLSEIRTTGMRMYHKGVIRRPESLSTISYQSAINFLISQGIILREDIPAAEGKKADTIYTLSSKRQNLNWRRMKHFIRIPV